MSLLHWTENGVAQAARWRSENSSPAPSHVAVVDDGITADVAYRLARAGTSLLWRGDYHNARQLLRALDRRFTRSMRQLDETSVRFAAHRAARAERAILLGRPIVHLDAAYTLALRRAPDVRQSCRDACGPPTGHVCVSLTEFLGVISADQWHQKGIVVPALDARIHPCYGVFSPVRGEYIDLVATASFPAHGVRVAFDLGTGVLAALLARRGVTQTVGTDTNPRAVACAHANLTRLDLSDRVQVIQTDLYPPGWADLIVCNPPWLPARPTSTLETAIYDPGSDMLHRFLDGLADHLTPGGEGWLILSDLAEHLGLRTRDDLLRHIAAAGLRVVDRHDTAPRHPRASDPTDALHAARQREVTSLWRLVLDNAIPPAAR